MSLNRAGAPAAEPVTLAEALAHVREISDEGGEIDSTLIALISAAREQCEVLIERTLISTRWRLALDGFPSAIRLDMPPILSVESVEYYDAEGVLQILHPDDYQVDKERRPGWILPAPGKTWPVVQAERVNAVTVNYTAGHGADAEAVPRPLRQWVLVAVAEMYDKRTVDLPPDFGAGLLSSFRMLGV